MKGKKQEVDDSKVEKVKLSSKMWLGGADCMMTTLCNIMTGGGLTFFFVTYFGMDPKWSATCWLIFGIWNAINDPIFGFISDHTKSKIGRRIPYIRYGAPIVAAVFILSWSTWFNPESNVQMFAQMLISLFLFDTLYTAIATSLYVMPFEMAVTNKARGGIFIVKIIFQLVALSVPLVLLAELENILNKSVLTYQMIMAIIGVVAGLIIFISSFFYKEKLYIKEEEQPPFGKAIAECFKNKSFLIFEMISFSITFINTALMIGLSYYFEADGINYLYCYIAMFAGIIAGLVMWMKLCVKIDVKMSMVLLCTIFAAGCLVLMLLGKYTVAGVFGFFCAGIGFAGGNYVIPMMNGDVIDYDESVSGLRREGMYAGVNSFICKPAISLANALFPIMLLWFGYDNSLAIAQQSELAKFGIRFSWLAIPAFLLILSAVIIGIFYPLCGEKWKATKSELAIKHEQKQKEFEEANLK